MLCFVGILNSLKQTHPFILFFALLYCYHCMMQMLIATIYEIKGNYPAFFFKPPHHEMNCTYVITHL